MKVRFISHASILVETNGLSILSDPWLSGKVFNNGWALVSPADTPDFSAITHVWISHEHPDHFHFPSLKAIPDADKERITILYQRHASPRVVDAIRKMGFTRIVELPLYRWHRLPAGVEVYCGSSGAMDSFLAIRDGDQCLLNMNDSVFIPEQLRYIKRQIGDVSILFTQFSFANWVGNDHDETHSAARKIEQFKSQIHIFRPTYTVPFASFCYFCSAENSRQNAWANTPDMIAGLNLPGVNYMYPGDEWDSAAGGFEHEKALERYRSDYGRMVIDGTPAPKELAEVTAAIETRLQEFKAKLRPAALAKLPPFSIFLHDLNAMVEIDPPTCTCRAYENDPARNQSARFVMCSQVAWFTFAFSFGGNTTLVSGMFLDREFATKGWHPFFSVQTVLSTEIHRRGDLQATLRTANFWWRKKGELFYRRMGRLRGNVVTDD
jgi:UDP-MurNAc hydroxylase